MFGLGPMELMVILVIALVFVGPERIPGVAASLGKAIRSFRKATRELNSQLDIDDEIRRPLEDLRSALRDEPPRPQAGNLMNPPVPVVLAPPAAPPIPHGPPSIPPVPASETTTKDAEPSK